MDRSVPAPDSRKSGTSLEVVPLSSADPRSIAGERLARLQPDLDAALERLVVRDGVGAGESLAHGFDRQTLFRNAGFLELARHHLGALLRQAQVERLVTARVGVTGNPDANIRQSRDQRAELGEPGLVAVTDAGLAGTELHRRTDLARLAFDRRERSVQRLHLVRELRGLGLAPGELLTLLLAVLAHDGANRGAHDGTNGPSGRATDDRAAREPRATSLGTTGLSRERRIRDQRDGQNARDHRGMTKLGSPGAHVCALSVD